MGGENRVGGKEDVSVVLGQSFREEPWEVMLLQMQREKRLRKRRRRLGGSLSWIR